MQKSEKFFIFSWRELVVIGLLGLTAVGFFFTLGLHYGKKLNTQAQEEVHPAENVQESPEVVPPKEILEAGTEHAESAAKAAIEEETKAEIEHSEVKVDHPKPVSLPSDVKKEAKQELKKDGHDSPAEPSGKYAIQLGSYPTQAEAKKRVAQFEKKGIHTSVRTAQVKGETRYRVVVLGFNTKSQADARGKELKSKNKLEGFVVIKAD